MRSPKLTFAPGTFSKPRVKQRRQPLTARDCSESSAKSYISIYLVEYWKWKATASGTCRLSIYLRHEITLTKKKGSLCLERVARAARHTGSHQPRRRRAFHPEELDSLLKSEARSQSA